MVALRRESPTQNCPLFDGRHPAGSRAVALHSGDGPERLCRRPLEAFRQRYGTRSASAQRWGPSLPFALEPIVSVRSEAAIYNGNLQRHLRRRRELICHDERPFSAAAQCHPRAASSSWARVPEFASETWHRQPDPRGHGWIHSRAGLFDGPSRNSR